MAKREKYSPGRMKALFKLPKGKASKGYEWKWEDHLTESSRRPKSSKVEASVGSI